MERIKQSMRRYGAFLTLFALAPAYANDAANAMKPVGDGDIGIEIARDAAEMRDSMRPQADVDVLNTALVFNNPRGHRALIVCKAKNGNGEKLGRAFTVVPAGGVRIILASDLSDGEDFIGSAICYARSRIIPSAFVLGNAFSDAPTRTNRRRNVTTLRFPIVASY